MAQNGASSSPDLSTVPLVPPPPGVVPNLVNPPEDSHIATIIFHAVLMPITALFVCGRLYHNLFVVKRIGWDDGKLLLSTPCGFRPPTLEADMSQLPV